MGGLGDCSNNMTSQVDTKRVYDTDDIPIWVDEASLEPEYLGEISVEIDFIDDLQFSPIPDELVRV